MRTLLILATLALAVGGLQAADTGRFQLELDAENAHLPSRLAWQDVALLNPQMTLNFTFTDFMYRTKYYREENKAVWAGKADARFVTDVDTADAALATSEADGYQVWSLRYASSYATITRSLMLHPTEDRCRIVYDLVLTKDLVIHEPIYFGPQLRLGPDFTTHAVPAADADAFTLLEATGYTGGQLNFPTLNPGPRLVQAPAKGVAMLVSYAWSGDLPDPIVTRLWQAKAGQTLSVTVDLQLARDAATLLPDMRRLADALPERHRPFLMSENAELLVKLDRIPDAEAMLLAAAATDTTYAAPYSRLAQLTKHPKSESTLTVAECFTYASYRQPYNYGWSLSGNGFPNDERLTEAERRQAIFNLLITVENCQFYPDYYVWVARHFASMQMYAQAAAMTRQALWALDRLPRPDDYRQKQRAKLEKALAAYEKHLIDDPTAHLPPLIQIDLTNRPTP